MKKIKKGLTSFQIIILGFAGVILLGTFLLMLPISSAEHVVTPFNTALFTATSAVCVTGLVLVDTATYWSMFGQTLILIMIQIGGLGVITVASIFVMISGGKISFMQRQTMQNALSADHIGGIVRLTKFVIVATFIIEATGAFLLLPVFCKQYKLDGIWMSVFHSITAFCNAGFDIMGSKTGQFSSLTSFQANLYLIVVICALVVIGGIGFMTWEDFVTKKFHFREYRLQSKIVLATSIVLIVIPFILFFFLVFSDYPMYNRICVSLFQTISPRTAGYNTVDYGTMNDNGLAITMLLMLIGGAPGSTAGGMKMTTIAVLCANTIAVFRRRDNANFFGRRIADSVVKNAATIFFMYVIFSMLGAFIISSVESLPLDRCMFETISAVATVGLSRGLTPSLGLVSQIVIIILMFFGRVGGLTVIYAAISNRDHYALKYPVENVMVG